MQTRPDRFLEIVVHQFLMTDAAFPFLSRSSAIFSFSGNTVKRIDCPRLISSNG